MLKASALYMVIIIATVIAIFTGALITTAFYYRLEVQKSVRSSKLQANLFSGIAIALSEHPQLLHAEADLDLFGKGSDSLNLELEAWGIYDLGIVKSFELTDTLKKAFLIAHVNTDPSAIYLSDEDRPLSVSGETQIKGDAELPKSGIKQSYVEGKPYSGSDLVYGTIRHSNRTLPEINEGRIALLNQLLNDTLKAGSSVALNNSFYHPAVLIRFDSDTVITDSIEGKIILQSDTLITIKKEARLRNILVFAPAIVVEPGFRGSCQLFARDSVVIGKNSVFEYPSAIGILKDEGSTLQSKIQLGENCRFSGVLFSYEKKRSDLQTLISLGRNSHVKGEIYACGYVRMEKPLRVDGKVSCNRFIIQTPTTLYENYLIDITIDRNQRSPDYLSSFLLKPMSNKQVLKWLN